ncbi:hypothetical protein B0O99DRAFT_747444 [Bisporella sp. PMI_857]|nr:hypothetical protein B0O99DRAFT_747444 [Bisporella sp. PMI_857]
MSALHYFDQGSSTPLGDLLSDVKSLFKLFHSITPSQWLAFECLVTIHTWIKEAPDLLANEAFASETKSGGWAPRRDSRLQQIIQEALDENAPDDSLWRFLYTRNNNLKPVIIFGVIYIHWKDNFKSPKKKPKSKDDGKPRDDGKSKSKKLNPEEEAKCWPTAAKQFLGEMLMEVKLPSKIADGMKVLKPKKRKKEEDENEGELHTPKQPRVESRHGSPATNRQLLDPAQTSMVAVGSHIQGRLQKVVQHSLGSSNRIDNPTQLTQPTLQTPRPPHPHSYSHPHPANPINEEFVIEKFTASGVEFNKSLLKYLVGKKCGAQKVGPSPESPVRVDPFGTKDGILLIFLGQTGKNLAKRAGATSKHRGFPLPSTHLYDHVEELIEPGDNFEMVYCQGIAIVWMPPDYFLVLVQKSYVAIRDDIRRARGESVQTLQKPR